MLGSGFFQVVQSHTSVWIWKELTSIQTVGQLLSCQFSEAIWETHKHVIAYFNQTILLHRNQSWFRDNQLCPISFTNFVDQWLSGINDNTFCGALFVDFAKAFGVLDHDHLLRNVAVYELSRETRASVLTDRKQTVQVDEPMNDLSDMEFPKVLFLDHCSSPFASVTSIYLSKQEVNSSKTTLLHILDTVSCFARVVIKTVLSFWLTCLLSAGHFRFEFFRSVYHAYILARRIVFT